MEIYQENNKELTTYRRLLFIAATVYLLWWFGVEALLPDAFNPINSRLWVVLTIYSLVVFSYILDRIKRYVRMLFIFSTWVITLHYFYLFYHNATDINWTIGCYVTIIAINLYLLSNAALISYSIFVIILALTLTYLVPQLRNSVFLPGLITIIIQANIGLFFRLGIIKTLTESNERFRLLFNTAFEGILLHENGRIIDVNDALCKMLGFSRTEFRSKTVLDIIDPAYRDDVAINMNKEASPPYETKGLTKDGTSIEIEVRARVFKYHNELARLVTVKDIRDRKAAEKERVTALTMAENVRIRDEFISIASHELKTPISSLKLQTQMIERQLQKAPTQKVETETINNFISLFHRQINRLTELVETMLDVSRISSGKLDLNISEVDLVLLVIDVVNRLQIQSITSNIPLNIKTPDHLRISVDPSRIAQVVENLLTNAIKYGDGKAVEISVSSNQDYAILRVEDHGLGIAKEHQERIFDRFERAISARHISGFGLGLYITRQIVEAHRGNISIKSELGVGSMFEVKIPFSTNRTLAASDL